MHFLLDFVSPYWYCPCMAHIHKKMKKGRPYYYVRETARVDGKPKVVNQVYLGSPERLLEMATAPPGNIKKLQVQEYGSLLIADCIDKEVGLAEIIDEVVGGKKSKTGPSVGEYFLYAVFNRMIDARSKRALPEWYDKTAVQQIRPVKTSLLSSRHFWRKWEQVSEADLRRIARGFFEKLTAGDRKLSSDCFLFDTTNYYTYMASKNESDLARRGRNKEGKNWLRQVGVALLVSRDEQIPLYYREYEGNRHDSRLFLSILDEVVAAMRNQGKKSLTIVFDKGMNAEENMAVLDKRKDVHFITTYSTYYAEDLVQVPLDRFEVVATDKNRRLEESGQKDDRLLAWRTTGEYWGEERVVVVTYNPLTATRQRYGFEKKLLQLQDILFEMQENVRQEKAHWRKAGPVMARYEDACSNLHLPGDLYRVEFYRDDRERLRMNFRKNHYRISRHINRFGKNILITDNMDWTTDAIVTASLDRYKVEDAFRLSKDDDLVSLMPLRHWTDSKIRCHILSCIVALAYLRLLEARLKQAGLSISAKRAMDSMRTLHSCLVWQPRQRKPRRIIEEPDPLQAKILQAFGLEINGGVLRDND